jgi:hypothetical protein
VSAVLGWGAIALLAISKIRFSSSCVTSSYAAQMHAQMGMQWLSNKQMLQ